jgi:UDP-glucose 4-epimerase
MNKVFITGASGFVGTKLVSALEADQNSVRVLSRRNLTGYETVVCDFLSDSLPDNALKGVDTVYHLAGVAHDYHKKNDQYIKVNVQATIKLAELAVNSGVKKFIFLSSVKAGGSLLEEVSDVKSLESQPKGIYGKTKRDAELSLFEIGAKSEMHVAIIRSSLVYGPLMKGNLGMMLKGIKNGWFPPLPKINNQRSLVHVDDLVRAMIFVSNDHRANGEIFIVTDGTSHSSREIYEVMCKLSGKSIPKWFIPKFIFDFAAFFSLKIRHKVSKLFDNDFYSSKKINAIGFMPKRTLQEMNETFF